MRRLLAAGLLAGTVVLSATPASAGGPTSVLITDPSSGTASALYYTDARYTQLDELLQRGEAVDAPRGGSLSGRAYNLTWMVHDVAVWRQQQVFLGAAGGPYVATTTTLEGDTGSTAWTRLTDAEGVSELLRDVFAAAGAGAGKPAGSAFEPGSPAEPTERVVTVTKSSTVWFALAGWRWVVPGLLLGLVAGGLVTLWWRGRPVAGPRQMLVDHSPERVGAR